MATRKIVDCKDLSTGNKVFPRTHAAAVLLSDGRSVDMAIEQFETVQEVYVINPNGEPSEVYTGLKAAWNAGVRNYALDFVLAAPCVVTYIGDEFTAVSITGIDEDRSSLQVLRYKITSTEITEVGNQEFPLGGITEESDPIFSASPVAGITEEQITSWDNKVNSNDEYYQKVCMVDMTGISYPESEAYTRIRTAIENGVTLFYCRVQTNSFAAVDLSYYPSVVRDIRGDGSEYEVITQLNIAGNTGIWIGNITAETLQSDDYSIGVTINSGIYLLTDGEGTKVLTDNGAYAELKTINGNSILGEGDIAVGADDSGKLEYVSVTPVISGSTATYTIPAGVLAFCNSHDSATSVVLNLDCSSFSDGEYHQFHIFVGDTSSASLSIGWQDAADSTINWPNGVAPTLEASYTTLELSLLGIVDSEDTNTYFFAYGAWNSLSPTT